MPSSHDTRKFKLTKMETLFAITISPIVIYLLYTVTFPLLLGDGLLFYSGAKQEAGRRAVDRLYSTIDNKIRIGYAMHVDQVRPTQPDEIEKYCTADNREYGTGPNDARYYTAEVSVRHILVPGVIARYLVDGCTTPGLYPEEWLNYRCKTDDDNCDLWI